MQGKQNDEMTVYSMIAAGIAMAAIILFFVIYAIAIMLTGFFTILCLLAWDNRLKLGSLTIEPSEARAFIGRGLIGIAAGPLFLVILGVLFSPMMEGKPYNVTNDIWAHAALIGYMALSLGWEIYSGEQPGETDQVVQYEAPPVIENNRSAYRPRSERPFEYASWDDEDAS